MKCEYEGNFSLKANCNRRQTFVEKSKIITLFNSWWKYVAVQSKFSLIQLKFEGSSILANIAGTFKQFL